MDAQGMLMKMKTRRGYKGKVDGLRGMWSCIVWVCSLLKLSKLHA